MQIFDAAGITRDQVERILPAHRKRLAQALRRAVDMLERPHAKPPQEAQDGRGGLLASRQRARGSPTGDGPKGAEVDLIAELPDRCVPFEVKYQDAEIDGQKLTGLRMFAEDREVEYAYVVTQRPQDFRVLQLTSARKGRQGVKLATKTLAIPAPIAFYWLSRLP